MIVSVFLPNEMNGAMWARVATGIYKTRSDFVREALDAFLVRELALAELMKEDSAAVDRGDDLRVIKNFPEKEGDG
jgi:Arc/MetJ-type ribon-helix-helix transcriptional regulator